MQSCLTTRASKYSLPLVAVAALGFCQFAHALNTENDYTGSNTGSILTGSNWGLGHVPTVTEDAVFTATTGIRTFNNGNLTVGSFNVTAATGTFTIRNATNNTTSTLTLGGAGDLGNGVSGTAADLLYAATGSTFTITGVNGTNALVNVVLGQSGNFNAAGTINVSSVISDGGNNFAVTKTGAGTLALQGANTYGGGTTLSTGTLSIENNSAIGTGAFTINGGTITNGGGSAVTLATNNAQTWGGNFSYAGTTGTNNLNLGNGAVTMTGSRTITVNGTTSTLTVGGSIGDGGNAFSLTKGSSGTGTLILNGANTYSGGTIISGGTLIANADGALGGGNVSLTGSTVRLTLQNGAVNDYIANTMSISMVTGSVTNLLYTGTDIVGGIVLAGVAQTTPGTYGAVGSTAIFQSAFFTGAGTLTLIPEPSTWAMIVFGMVLLVGTQRFRSKKS